VRPVIFHNARLSHTAAMAVLNPQIVLFLLAAGVVGVMLGWLLHSNTARRHASGLNDEWQLQVDDLTRQRDRLRLETEKLRETIEVQQGAMHRHEVATTKAHTDLQSSQERANSLAKDVHTLRAERENTKAQLGTMQNHLLAVKQQTSELQQEFVKSGDFYKKELKKSFEKRKLVEVKLENAKVEHDSFHNLLKASRSEQESVNKILGSAQTRLESLDVLEQRVIELEAENAQLNHDAARMKQENEALQRDAAELDELRLQNKELSHCLKSMEHSRKQYEDDATRYRENAGAAEQQSETLRIKLDDLEKNFADIEKQQRRAIKNARKVATVDKINGHKKPPKEVDDLKEIIGIGKVFERTLNDLGVFNFRQIATFGVADIARVNAELKEFKGRMEQDDWIGQAKELHFKKYGETG